MSYAAAIQRLIVPDRSGKPVDVVLGYPDVEGYEANGGAMGSVVGRFANRIAGAKFYLNAEEYHVTVNDHGNCLHSGEHGFMRTVFEMEPAPDGGDGVLLRAVSPDGTDGFPGNVTLEVLYTLAGSGLMIQYTATTDAPTVINITNHSYFNLNGHASGTVLGHRLSMDAPEFLETDADLIPTGRILPVAGTALDFTEEKTLGRDIGGRRDAAEVRRRVRPLPGGARQRAAAHCLADRPADRHPHGDAVHAAWRAAVHLQHAGSDDALQGRRAV